MQYMGLLVALSRARDQVRIIAKPNAACYVYCDTRAPEPPCYFISTEPPDRENAEIVTIGWYNVDGFQIP